MINGPRTNPASPMVKNTADDPDKHDHRVDFHPPAHEHRAHVDLRQRRDNKYPRMNRIRTPRRSPSARAYAPMMINATEIREWG